MTEAAKAVGAHAFIMRLPQGYETPLEQRGGNLSLGQRQLLSFARALVADAKILVLDEATASVDSYTERLIQAALARLLEGRTGLVIAHRLATVRNADRIIVLQDGRVVESACMPSDARARPLRQALSPQLRIVRRRPKRRRLPKVPGSLTGYPKQALESASANGPRSDPDMRKDALAQMGIALPIS